MCILVVSHHERYSLSVLFKYELSPVPPSLVDEYGEIRKWLETTQPTSGGAVTTVTNCCANCVEPSSPQQWGPDEPFCGQAGHADPLNGWRCFSQKRVMSRIIQVRQHQTNESGFVVYAINKYMLGSRYPAQVSAKHNTQISGPAIYTDNPDSYLTQT